MGERRTIFDRKPLQLHLPDQPTSIKLFHYFFYSALAIVAGYSIGKPGTPPLKLLFAILILPSLYFLNYSYYQIYQCFAKNVLRRITWFRPNNKDNIFQSHAIFLNLVIVYFVYSHLLGRFTDFAYNAAVLSILMVYTVLFFIHRCLRDVDEYLQQKAEERQAAERKAAEQKADEQPVPEQVQIPALVPQLLSLLKYKASSHVHIFAGTAVGLPFFVGVALTMEHLDLFGIIRAGGFSYLLYAYTWSAFYQHKYKSSSFVDRRSIWFLVSLALYPAFPVLFFILYHRALSFFYFIFVLSSILYVMPVIYSHTSDHSPLRVIVNERLILYGILAILGFTFWQGEPKTAFPSVESMEFGYSAVGLLACAGLVLLERGGNDEDAYRYYYLILPYLTLTLAHLVVWVVHKFMDLNNPHRNCLSALAEHLIIIEMVYVAILVVMATIRGIGFMLKKQDEDGKD